VKMKMTEDEDDCVKAKGIVVVKVVMAGN